ncbi:oxidoreductase C-terminal domain-containing protein [Streptomyces sp. NBC_01579]|uniref:oxidoreductase C-terminal domain-containing protein n=1 Tax=Streptomyces sp. NBC_01579 TaxID=2975885 RepID=UPI00386B61C1
MSPCLSDLLQDLEHGHGPSWLTRHPTALSEEDRVGGLEHWTEYTEAEGYNRVVLRGEPSERRFITLRMAANRVLAGMSVDTWDVMHLMGSLITSESDIDDMSLSDPNVPLDRNLPRRPGSGRKWAGSHTVSRPLCCQSPPPTTGSLTHQQRKDVTDPGIAWS